VDVTYVDKFGIPLQLEWFSGSRVVSGSYVYLSTRSLVDRFAQAGLGQAAFSLNATNITAGWTYSGTNSYTNFARILAPQKISGTGSSVAPYPSVTNYLNSLAASGQSFWLNGASPHGDNLYRFLGYVARVSTNAGGWLVTLSKGADSPPFDPSLINGADYTSTITFPISYANAGQYVYGSPVGPHLYSVDGTLVTDDTHGTYKVETWMIGDVLSALNFGFWGGRYGTNSADWFTPVQWTAFPFGSARPTSDGYFNSYAALLYNYSDPYSYAFSERITPDVLMAPLNGDRMRITILPDDRLDSPTVPTPATDSITTNSITLNWAAVSGATGYQVNILRPLGLSPVSLPSSSLSYTLTDLQSGTPYVMSVQAKGTGANGNPIITPARPVSATTLGSAPASQGGMTQVQVTFNAADPFYQLGKVYINSTEMLRTGSQWNAAGTNVPARWIAGPGTNQVIVTVVNTNNQVIFNDWLTFALAPPFTTNGETHSAISNVLLHGQKLSAAPPALSGFLNGGTNTSFLVTTQNVSVSIGLSYVPAEIRKLAPLSTIATPPTGMVITDLALPPGGGIQFKFDVPAGTNYAVEASSDLKAWHTNATGIGQVGREAYSEASRTNAIQFYRVNY
jgi:hypothetical protein